MYTKQVLHTLSGEPPSQPVSRSPLHWYAQFQLTGLILILPFTFKYECMNVIVFLLNLKLIFTIKIRLAKSRRKI